MTHTCLHFGFVDDSGHFALDDKSAFKAEVDRLRGQEVQLTIQKRRYQRSLKANAYYHACVVQPLADHLGYEHDEMHEALAFHFLRIDDDPLTQTPRRKSTRDLSTAEMADYIDRCIRFCAEHGVVVPEPHTMEAA